MNRKLRHILLLFIILILGMSSVYGYTIDTTMSQDSEQTNVTKDVIEKEPLNTTINEDTSTKSKEVELKSSKESNTIVLKLKDIDDVEELNISEEISTTYTNIDAITIEIPQGADPNKIIAKYKKDSSIEEVYVDEVVQLFYAPTDPYYTSSQWNLKKINMESAWDSSKGDSSVVVAVIDTGFGPFLDVDGVVKGVDVSGSTILEDTYPGQYSYEGSEHGTAVASVIAANINNVGIAGIAPNVSLMPVKVFANGTDDTGSIQVAAGIRWAADHGADLINLSLGSDYGSPVEEDAIQYALSKEVMIIAASGNAGYSNFISYPASYDGVIAVGSTNQNDHVSVFSNEGSNLDLVAPGESIKLPNISTGVGVYESYSGTSFSSPTVCAIASLVKSKYPGYPNQKVEEILYAGTDDIGTTGWDTTSGNGRISGQKVMALAANNNNSKFMITFDTQGGTTINSIEVPYNTSITRPADPTRSGYTFIGWYKESNCTNVWDFNGDKVTKITKLYAKWIANPTTPTGLKATSVDPTTIKLTWSPVSGASGYEIHRSTTKTGTYSRVSSSTTTSYNNTGLTSGKVYYYKVKTYKIVDNKKIYGSYSSIVSAKPIPSTPKLVKSASNSYNSNKISWGAISGVSGYEVFRATSSKGTYSIIATTTAPSYINTKLTTGKTYYYKVRASKTIESKKLYGNFSTVVSTRPVPSKPENSKAVIASYNSISTSWNKVSGASSYQLYRATSKTGEYSLIKTTNSTNYTNTGLTTNKAYYYKVRAYKTIGETKFYGVFSSIVSATTRNPLAPNYTLYSSPDTKKSTDYVGFHLTNNGTKTMRVYSGGSYLINEDDHYNRYLQLIHQNTKADISWIEIPAGKSQYVMSRVLGNQTRYDQKSNIYFEFTYDRVKYMGNTSSYYENYYWRK